MKLLIVGSRNWKDHRKVAKLLQRLHTKYSITLVATTGRCKSELMVYDVASLLGIQIAIYHLNRDKYGVDALDHALLSAVRTVKPDRIVILGKAILKRKAVKSLKYKAKKHKIAVKVIQ